MHAHHLALLARRHDGTETPITIQGTPDGVLRANGEAVGRVVDGIARFTEEAGLADLVARLRGERRFHERLNGSYPRPAPAAELSPAERLCVRLAAAAGTILEIGAGPGGGLCLPDVLHHNAQASIIINDIQPAVLEAWAEALRDEKMGPNVSLASFDATDMPIRSGSIAAVASASGFGNIDVEGGQSRYGQSGAKIDGLVGGAQASRRGLSGAVCRRMRAGYAAGAPMSGL